MRTKRLLSLVMALFMLFTLTAPTFAWALEGDGNDGAATTGGTETGTETGDAEPGTETGDAEPGNTENSPAAVAAVDGEDYADFGKALAAALESGKVLELKANAAEPVTLKDGETLKVKAGEYKITVKAAEGCTLTASEPDKDGVVTYEAKAEQPVEENEDEEPKRDGTKGGSTIEGSGAGPQNTPGPNLAIPGFDDPTDPTEHPGELQHTAAKDATCTEPGNSEYWYCGTCGKYFSDAQGTTEITLESTAIPALGHDMGGWTYGNNGATRKCSRCEYSETVAYPQAVVTDLSVANPVTVNGVDYQLAKLVRFDFADGQPTQDQLDVFGNWYCDYVVYADHDVPANSMGLYGAYGGLTQVLTSHQDIHANQEITLVNDVMGGDLKFIDIYTFVHQFTCGAFDVNYTNAGTTLYVQLRIWDDDNHTHTVNTMTHTFASAPAATVTVDDTGATTTVTPDSQTATAAEIPANTFVAGNDKKPVAVSIPGSSATVTFTDTAAAAIATAAGDSAVELSVTTATENGVMTVTIAMTAGSTEVFDATHAAGAATVTVPYAVADGKLPVVNLVVGGVKTPVPVTGYTATTVTFQVPHFSQYEVSQQDATVSVTASGETKYYDDLAYAISQAADGATVTLLKNVTGLSTITIPAGKTVTLDLNGHTVEAATNGNDRHFYAIENHGTLTLKDTVGTGSISARGILNEVGGTMYIQSGTYVAIDTNGGAAIWNEGTLYMSGGTLRVTHAGSSSDQYGPGCLSNRGTATITKGTFISVNKRTYAIISTGTITIDPAQDSDVVVTGAHGGLAVDSGTATVNGGQFTSTEYYGLYVSNDGTGTAAQAQVTVNGGEFTGKSQSVHIGSDVNTPVDSVIVINDGVFHGTINAEDKVVEGAGIAVSGGTFDNAVPDAYCAAGYIPTDNGSGTYGVDGPYEAKIGTTGYTTLAAAFAAAQDGDTVTLLSDVDATDSMYSGDNRFNLWISKSITLDLASHTLTVNGRGIGIKGASGNIDVTIKNGTVTNHGNANGRCIDTRGKLNSLTLDNVTLTTAESSYSGYLQPLTIGGSQATAATVTIKNSNIIVNNAANKGYAITTFNPVNMTITGSTIKGWACLNLKGPDSSAGSSGSDITVSSSTLVSANGTPGDTNAYSLIKIEDNNVNVAITGSTINVNGGDNTQSIVSFQKLNQTNSANCTVTLGNGNNVTLEGQYRFESNVSGTNSGLEISGGTFNVEVPMDVCAEGYIPEPANEQGKYTVGGPYVATLTHEGTVTGYASLKAAVTAAADGDTITLLADANGEGLFIGPNKFTSSGLTIDFNGKTYTVETPVGSPGTVNQMLHFEEGNKITLTNGSIVVTDDNSKLDDFDMIMQNYGTLVIDEMTINGTGIAVAQYGTFTGAWAAFSNTNKPQFNYNTAGNSVIRKSTITVVGDIGIDDAAGLTIEGDAVINANAIVTKGTDDRYNSATPTVTVENGAKFKLADSTGAAAFDGLLAKNGQSLGTAVSGVYTVEAIKAFAAYDSNGDYVDAYITLNAAIEAAGNGGIVKLVEDYVGEAYISSQVTPITFDLNGHSITNAGMGINMSMGYYWNGDHVLTIKDSVGTGSINVTSDAQPGYACVSDNVGRTIIIESGTFNSVGKAIYCTSSNATMTIEGGTFNGTIYVHDTGYGHGNLSITDGTFTGTLQAIDNAEIAVSGGNFSSPVPEEYCEEGYIPAAADPETGLYSVKVGSYVAQIGSTKYETLAAAFAAAADGDTITLLADVALTERLFVNAGATPAYAGTGNRYATTSENKAITLDLNGHNITSSSNIALAGGSLNITGTGTISTSVSGLAPIEIRGTGDLTNKRTLTIGEDVTLTGSEYGLNVFGSNDAQKNTIDVTVNGTVNGMLFVLGNLKNTSNSINIVVNGTVDASEVTGTDEAVHTGIAICGNAAVTVNNGAVVKGESGIEVRAGSLTVNGGTITATASTYSYVANGSGTTTKGAAIAVAAYGTTIPTTATLNGGTLTGVKQIGVTDVNDDMSNVTVTATQSYTQNSTIPEGYEWVETSTTGVYTLAKKAVEVAGLKALGAALALEGKIIVRIVTTPVENSTVNYVTLTINGRTRNVLYASPDHYNKNTNEYIFDVAVHAKEMNDMIVLKAFDKNGNQLKIIRRMDGQWVESDKYTYSVMTYVNLVGDDKPYKNLVDAMSIYGDYAKYYFDHPYDNVSMEGNLPPIPANVLENYKAVKSPETWDGPKYMGGALALEEGTYLRVIFTGPVDGYTFTCGNNELEPVAYGNMFYVNINNVAAKDLDTWYTIIVTNNSTHETYTVQYCALSYVRTVINSNSTSQTLKDAMTALYWYNQKANGYFEH